MAGQRSSATPPDRAHENVRRRLVKQMCRASANVAWLPTAFSAGVRMSEEQILDATMRPPNLRCLPEAGVRPIPHQSHRAHPEPIPHCRNAMNAAANGHVSR